MDIEEFKKISKEKTTLEVTKFIRLPKIIKYVNTNKMGAK